MPIFEQAQHSHLQHLLLAVPYSLLPSPQPRTNNSSSIHDLGLIGHIEEIAIAREHQKKRLGLALLDALNVVAQNVGCYKTTLGCGERTEGFYVKCGYEKRATVMSRYFEGPRVDYERG
jgi:GNAT superfamily N-acetyltransferase